jgi:putative restriction endonuclease
LGAGSPAGQRGGVRAPPKPLLLLFVLGRLQLAGTTAVSFREAEGPLRELLREFGRPGTHPHPEYPFYHLQSDGLWVLAQGVQASPGSSPSRGRLLALDVVGRLVPDFVRALKSDAGLLVTVGRVLLDRTFPASLHQDVCAAVGLDLEGAESRIAPARRARSIHFRNEVLLAYEWRCAICGYRGQVERRFVGLDGAHIRWWASAGPDTVDNGLCLCSLHHKLLDSGVLSISDEYRVLVSRQFIALNADDLVFRFGGRPLLPPQSGPPPVHPKHLAWHRRQVFRGLGP